jgi:hypothetical protein
MRYVTTTLLTAALVVAGLAWNQQPVLTQSVSAPRTVPGIDKPVRVIRGRFTQDLVLTSDTYWVLRGAVFIGAPARLFIQPGTRVIGELATRGTLVIERGAQIFADGTAEQPIVMTSDQPIGSRGRGDWGGLVINGRAPINPLGVDRTGEGQTGVYGGTNPDDSSGVLRYVRVEFAGIEFSPDNELNGIAFQGVGRGTIVENIQVHFNKDDGVEFFGGTVDVKRVLLTNIGDDFVDWTFGWIGRMQYVVAQARADDCDNGIEADNNANSNDELPRSSPTIYNLTLIGDRSSAFGTQCTDGMRLREGTAGIVRNFIATGWRSDGIDVRNTSTENQVAAGALRVTHGILFNNASSFNSLAAPLVAASGGTVVTTDPGLIAPFNLTTPDFRPAPGSAALLRTPAVPPADGFFEFANFIGGVGPTLEEDWTRGWTTFAQN